MAAQLLLGKEPAAVMETALAERVRGLGVRPGLVIIHGGDDAASQVYVKNKVALAGKLGIAARLVALPTGTARAALLAEIGKGNDDPSVHGLLVQLPLSAALHGSEDMAAAAISPGKDVDCFHPENLGLLVRGRPRFLPCTPAGIIRLLEHYRIPLRGKTTVIIGRSLIVGRPLMLMLSAKGVDATVAQCHSCSQDMDALTRQADLLVVAVGCAEMVTPEMVKPGAVVVDVGINRVDDPSSAKGYRLTGDVAPSVADVAGALTPVPGGVGIMTTRMLMENVVRAAELSQ